MKLRTRTIHFRPENVGIPVETGIVAYVFGIFCVTALMNYPDEICEAGHVLLAAGQVLLVRGAGGHHSTGGAGGEGVYQRKLSDNEQTTGRIAMVW